jgi:hypothetical protein
MTWKPEVKVSGEWARNGLVFETEQEAKDNANNLMMRWIMVEDCRAIETDEPANYRWTNGGLVSIGGEDKS